MRLIFVHGINQQDKSSEALLEEWGKPLREALARLGLSDAFTAEAPFYGDLLRDATKGHVTPQGMGDAPVTDDEADFLERAMVEIAARAPRVDEGEVAAVANDEIMDATVGQGFPMHRRINAVVRVLERISPFHGEWALRLLQQAYTYLKSPGVSNRVDAVVTPYLREGPAVIVAHSLGTIVTFRLLRKMAEAGNPLEVPLLVTLGSPLSLRTVRTAIQPKYLQPAGVGHWLNAYDPDDFVALGQGLTAATFCDGIENVGDVVNVPDDAHSIVGYLADSRVATAIGAALGYR